jgi:hypothetical protein
MMSKYIGLRILFYGQKIPNFMFTTVAKAYLFTNTSNTLAAYLSKRLFDYKSAEFLLFTCVSRGRRNAVLFSDVNVW